MQYGSRTLTSFMGNLVGLTESCVLFVYIERVCRIGLPILRVRVRVSLHILCRGGAQEGAMVNALCINNAA